MDWKLRRTRTYTHATLPHALIHLSDRRETHQVALLQHQQLLGVERVSLDVPLIDEGGEDALDVHLCELRRRRRDVATTARAEVHGFGQFRKVKCWWCVWVLRCRWE